MLQVPYPPPRVTFLDIAGVVAQYREHSYMRWFLVCDGQPNSASLLRSYSLPNGTARLRPPKPKKEPKIPQPALGDQNPTSPVRHRYLNLESPSRVRSRSEPAGPGIPGVDPHELRFRYDARVKGFEEQVAGLKSSVKNSDLTRTQRRLQYLDYRTDDPVVAWARRKCKTMQTTYTEARSRVEQALAQRDVSSAARAFAQLERTLTVEDDFMRTSRTRIQAMADKRSGILMEMENALRERRATTANELHETWPYAHDDVGLTAVRTFLQEYEVAKAQLMAMITSVQTSRDGDSLEAQMASWTFAVDDAPFPDAQHLLEVIRAAEPSRTQTGGTDGEDALAPEAEAA